MCALVQARHFGWQECTDNTLTGAVGAQGRIHRGESSTVEGQEVMIPETTRLSRTWLNTHNAVYSMAGKARSNSSVPAPADKDSKNKSDLDVIR